MRKTMISAGALAAAALLSTPAWAGSDEGHWQIKVLGTGVLPDGKITQIKNNTLGLPAGSQTQANDNFVPTLAIEYFFTPNVSVETICCLTQHHIDGAGAIAGTNIVNHVMVLPATMTLKYHSPPTRSGRISALARRCFSTLTKSRGPRSARSILAGGCTWTTSSARRFKQGSISRFRPTASASRSMQSAIS